jgi:UDP-3-O-[3-hydroxymyristoyl] glucosamine N-acyltransferase
VLMPNVSVGYHSIVDTCVIDEEVNIGKSCYIGFGKSSLPGDSRITVLGKGVTVPSHTAIGRNCTVFPHVDTSGFRGNLIASGSIISQQGSAQNVLARKG